MTTREVESPCCFFVFGWIKLEFGVKGNFRLLISNLNSKPEGGDFFMSGIRVCATDQGRFFTSKNPEQAPNF